ncbi:MAG: protein-methionine-sulfoxide reductase catalytic subunit MsrP [Nitrospirae bacterium]|nr:MAG: protein-methionine-sulfoxide reductase catalytic subunit MsrP [Nitrospirota bacterium]
MANLIFPPSWRVPEQDVTPESVYLQSVTRRTCLKLLSASALMATGLLPGCSAPISEEEFARTAKNYEWSDLDRQVYPAARNSAYTLDRPLTAEHIAAQYNNFYEFSQAKDDVWKRVRGFQVRPWTLEVSGLVRTPLRVDMDWVLKHMPLEERVYRHRCVEAWAMAVPWTGFPLKTLLLRVEPLPQARYVKFTSFYNPEIAMGQRGYGPWPYTEGLTLAEAMHDLTLLVTGIYGHPLPKQHGAPIRLVVPWKYGFKSIKSIVSIELTDQQPATFWNTLVPFEYDFQANVNPHVPHPRWSQATERMIGTGQRLPTRYLNGYDQWVGSLYA